MINAVYLKDILECITKGAAARLAKEFDASVYRIFNFQHESNLSSAEVKSVSSGKVYSIGFQDGKVVSCSCSIGITLGIPCRHALYAARACVAHNIHVSISTTMLDSRWYKDDATEH
jgi:hypothetical protein